MLRIYSLFLKIPGGCINETEHGLSQTALGGRLKMTQPAVARLKGGEHNPAVPGGAVR